MFLSCTYRHEHAFSIFDGHVMYVSLVTEMEASHLTLLSMNASCIDALKAHADYQNYLVVLI